MTSGDLGRRPGRRHTNAGIAAMIVAAVLTGCGPPGAGGPIVSPTYIPQPTPDATMAAVIRGQGSPVVYLPPLEIKGSPTPVPAAGRPGSSSASRPATKPSGAARDTTPAREPAPAPKPAREAAPVPKPAPTAAARPAPTATRGTTSTGAGAAPAIINPNTALPGGAGRPNPTPSR